MIVLLKKALFLRGEFKGSLLVEKCDAFCVVKGRGLRPCQRKIDNNRQH